MPNRSRKPTPLARAAHAEARAALDGCRVRLGTMLPALVRAEAAGDDITHGAAEWSRLIRAAAQLETMLKLNAPPVRIRGVLKRPPLRYCVRTRRVIAAAEALYCDNGYDKPAFRG